MRFCAAILMLLCLCPLTAGDRLTDEQLLQKLDVATASEARWILRAELFATGAVGIDGHYTRACVAYTRLLRTADAGVFATLAQSEQDIAACFGIAGIAELAPDRLPALLPDMILRRRAVPESSGCMGGDATAFTELASAIARHGGLKDKSVLESAWQSFLEFLASAEAAASDSWVVSTVQEILGSLPRPISPTETYSYALALAGEDSTDALRALAGADEGGASSRLALQYLAAGLKPRVESDSIKSVWARTLNTPEALLDLRIQAEYWERVAQGLNREDAEFDLADCYDCPWHGLTDGDWTWLASNDSEQVRDAVARLKSNPIAGWRIDAEMPEDAAQRRHARLCLLAAADGDTVAAHRARYLLSVDVAKAEDPLPLGLQWRGGRTTDRELVDIVGANQVTGLALIAASSDGWNQHLNGVQLITAALAVDEKAARGLAAENLLPHLLKRLWKECDEAPSTVRWPLRLMTMAILEATWTTMREDFPERDETWQKWLTDLGKQLVSNPRSMPPELDQSALRDLIMIQSDSRAGDLVDAIYDGEDDFLPDDETPNKRPEEEKDPSPALIYKRMQEAAAKLK